MTEAALAREWTAFGGASLGLMGAALALSARSYAKDHLAWQRERDVALGAPPTGDAGLGRLVGGYRAGGLAVAALGLGVLASAALGVGPAPRVHLEDARISGSCLALLGVLFAVVKFRRGGPRLAEPADVPVWALCMLWAAFGVRLALGAAK